VKNRNYVLPSLVVLAAAVILASPAATRALRLDRLAPGQGAPAADTAPAAVGRAGLVAHVDPETGQLGGMEVVEFDATEVNALRTDAEGLLQEHHPDGSVSMDLEGRFQSATMATVGADGTIRIDCVGSHDDANGVLCNHGSDHRALEVK
jgi:hypothetical protein